MVTRRFSASRCVSVSMASDRPNNGTVDRTAADSGGSTCDGRLRDGSRHLADKRITAPGNVGDIASSVLAITQRFAQCGDLRAQGDVLNKGILPYPRTERLLADRLPRLLEQRDQKFACTVPDANRRFALEKKLPRREQAKRTKREPGFIPAVGRSFRTCLSCPARPTRWSSAKAAQATIARHLATSVQFEQRQHKTAVVSAPAEAAYRAGATLPAAELPRPDACSPTIKACEILLANNPRHTLWDTVRCM